MCSVSTFGGAAGSPVQRCCYPSPESCRQAIGAAGRNHPVLPLPGLRLHLCRQIQGQRQARRHPCNLLQSILLSGAGNPAPVSGYFQDWIEIPARG